MLLFGYVRTNTDDSAPIDIMNLCLLFYNQTLKWNINCECLKQFISEIKNESKTVNDEQTTLKLYGDDNEFFEIDGIQMRWRLDPIPRYNQGGVHMYLEIPHIHINKITITP